MSKTYKRICPCLFYFIWNKGESLREAADVHRQAMLSWLKRSASSLLPSCTGYWLEESSCSLRLRRSHTPPYHPDTSLGSHFGWTFMEVPCGKKQASLSRCCLQNSETQSLQIGGRHSAQRKMRVNVHCTMLDKKKEECKLSDSYLVGQNLQSLGKMRHNYFWKQHEKGSIVHVLCFVSPLLISAQVLSILPSK